MADSPLTMLADVLAAQRDAPMTRIGKVSAVSKTGSVWYADVLVEGGTATRRMRWTGNGGQPAVNDLVFYLNESPMPIMLGRVSNDNEAQNFGNGAVSGGTISDSQGNLRTGINQGISVGQAAQVSANQGISVGSAAQSSANQGISAAALAASSAANAQSTANNALSAAQNAQNNANNAQGRINNLDAYARSIEQSLINLYGQVNFLNTRINNLEAYATSLERTLITFLGPGGPDD